MYQSRLYYNYFHTLKSSACRIRVLSLSLSATQHNTYSLFFVLPLGNPVLRILHILRFVSIGSLSLRSGLCLLLGGPLRLPPSDPTLCLRDVAWLVAAGLLRGGSWSFLVGCRRVGRGALCLTHPLQFVNVRGSSCSGIRGRSCRGSGGGCGGGGGLLLRILLIFTRSSASN